MTQYSDSNLQAKKPGEHLLQELKWVHNALRRDLLLCQILAEQVAAGAAAEYIREQIKSLQTSSPLWKLRVNCLYYCRFVHAHHHGEDVALFPALRRTNPALAPVVDRLVFDHRKISGLLDEIEASAKSLGVQDGTAPRARLVQALGDLSTDLLEHLAFEEEAIGPTLLEWETWPFDA